ncbi:hypothetical protein [Persicirhabdus sediminis]|uniref:HdeA/HdeB family protein n=1 Tax=Persicirhabdus sediminis TaxID=454144 RepID=A0A8J7SGY1_9BACT|nr:hypothetical protein [Persicirhabdus sediminis]MBK1790425.1 hypothetical protein [Persicirhabdus sediminis]
MKKTTKFALFSAALAAVTAVAPAQAADCVSVANTVKKAVADSPGDLLEVVAKTVSANESCACEIVKAAIIATEAEKELVAAIASTAMTAAPDKARIIAQCSVAVAPDALAEVQAVYVKFAANSGESGYSSKGGEKSAKGAKEPIAKPASSNPLDFPNGGNDFNPVGPTIGGPGGSPLLPAGVPVGQPPVVTPPAASPDAPNNGGGSQGFGSDET